MVSPSVSHFNRILTRKNGPHPPGCVPSASHLEFERDAAATRPALGDAYDAAVVARLRDVLASAPATSWPDAFSKMRGAFPQPVYELAVRSGLDRHIVSSKTSVQGRQASYEPELHPLDFEWYFTASSAQYVAKVMTSDGGLPVFVGAPTAANESVCSGSPAVLIDRNSLVVRRFPALSSQFVLSDVRGLPSALHFAHAVSSTRRGIRTTSNSGLMPYCA